MIFRRALAIVVVFGCGTGEPTKSATTTHPEKLTLTPKLEVGGRFVFHLDVVVETETSGRGDRGEMHLDDTVVVTSPAEMREQFSNVTASGDGSTGDALRRVALALPTGSATTRFDEHWQKIATLIEGTTDDEVRTMIMNLTPVVSFRMLPSAPVSVGDEWATAWHESLRSGGNEQVKTSVRYRLASIAPCGSHRCATITTRGSDVIPQQGATTGTSEISGEIVVDLTNLVPVSKAINSKTHLQGAQDGRSYDYTNSVRVDVRRNE